MGSSGAYYYYPRESNDGWTVKRERQEKDRCRLFPQLLGKCWHDDPQNHFPDYYHTSTILVPMEYQHLEYNSEVDKSIYT